MMGKKWSRTLQSFGETGMHYEYPKHSTWHVPNVSDDRTIFRDHRQQDILVMAVHLDFMLMK